MFTTFLKIEYLKSKTSKRNCNANKGTTQKNDIRCAFNNAFTLEFNTPHKMGPMPKGTIMTHNSVGPHGKCQLGKTNPNVIKLFLTTFQTPLSDKVRLRF